MRLPPRLLTPADLFGIHRDERGLCFHAFTESDSTAAAFHYANIQRGKGKKKSVGAVCGLAPCVFTNGYQTADCVWLTEPFGLEDVTSPPPAAARNCRLVTVPALCPRRLQW